MYPINRHPRLSIAGCAACRELRNRTKFAMLPIDDASVEFYATIRHEVDPGRILIGIRSCFMIASSIPWRILILPMGKNIDEMLIEAPDTAKHLFPNSTWISIGMIPHRYGYRAWRRLIGLCPTTIQDQLKDLSVYDQPDAMYNLIAKGTLDHL
jgi:hypothetical protein